MPQCFFVSDLHGQVSRYEKLFNQIVVESPSLVFLGGDILPSALHAFTNSKNTIPVFIREFLIHGFQHLKKKMGAAYPRVFLILGNDDARSEEPSIIEGEVSGIWEYMHNKKAGFMSYSIFGYACVPPTPFLLKDWERYDVSRYVDPGCVPPEEGFRTISVNRDDMLYGTIGKDLEILAGNNDVSKSIFLFHTPPYKTSLDRAALDDKMVDNVPLDVHVGSIAVRKFIETKQPLITLHGHIHESTRYTGNWSDTIGNTYLYNAAHDGPELALIRFDPEKPAAATRELL